MFFCLGFFDVLFFFFQNGDYDDYNIYNIIYWTKKKKNEIPHSNKHRCKERGHKLSQEPLIMIAPKSVSLYNGKQKLN